MELFNGKVIEPEFAENAEYILVNNEDFYDIGFRVMKNQEKDGIIPCHRMKYNGKIKLVYFTEYYTPLKHYVKRCAESQLGFILGRLWKSLQDVQENGFINVNTIDLRLEKIFVDEKAQTIKLIYLPINSDEHITTEDARASLEARLVAELNRSLPQTSVEVPVARPVAPVVKPAKVSNSAGGINIVGVAGGVSFSINQPSFVIGKSPDKADGVISGNPAISRMHCKVIMSPTGNFITDLGSSNGTFVNGSRLAPNQSVAIKSGDRIKLANVDFVVE